MKRVISGLTAVTPNGKSEVFVASIEGGWAIRYVTGSNVTKFAISPEALEVTLSLIEQIKERLPDQREV